MTDARITQQFGQTLAEGDSEPHITQQVVNVLIGVNPPARIMQQAMQVLVDMTVQPRIMQQAIQVLATAMPCLSYLVQCWKITRRDGEIFTFTEHDQPVEFRGDIYSPCGSIQASAYENSGKFGEIGNGTCIGILSLDGNSAGLEASEISAGLFDAATVEIWAVAWQGLESPMAILKGYIGNITLKDISYEAEVITQSGLLSNRSLLETFTPTCRFMLGDARCTVDLTPFTEISDVTEKVAGSARFQAGKRQFIDIARIEADDTWQNGILTWTTGNNTGFSSEVAASTDDGVITLWNVMPFTIEVGDNYSIVRGCDKRFSTCKDVFSNEQNFGGFKDIPGNDVILKTPDAKE